MDAIDTLKHIQQMVLADRTKRDCKTTICPKCFKHTYTISPNNRVKVCVDCGYYELTKNGKTEIFEGEGVFALNHKDNVGIFPIEKGILKLVLKIYLWLSLKNFIQILIMLMIVFCILLKMERLLLLILKVCYKLYKAPHVTSPIPLLGFAEFHNV